MTDNDRYDPVGQSKPPTRLTKFRTNKTISLEHKIENEGLLIRKRKPRRQQSDNRRRPLASIFNRTNPAMQICKTLLRQLFTGRTLSLKLFSSDGLAAIIF